MQRKWDIITCDEDAASNLAAKLEIHSVTAKILLNRGIDTTAKAQTFLDPSLSDIPDPFQFPQMKRATTRIAEALSQNECIAIFGDYDVDGITGATLLTRFLREVGADPIVHLPHRLSGYGLNEESIRELKGKGAKLLITVDNGARASKEMDLARELGMDVIITDHHALGEEVLDVHANINPHRLSEGHPMQNLSGCGVAFILAIALRKELRERGMLGSPEPNLKRHLDLVALGTIADVVPLTNTNRLLVKHGLLEISMTSKPGLIALLNVSGTSPIEVSPGVVGFRLAPRLNAAGRIGDPNEALELLLSDDSQKAHSIAESLDRANRERQSLERRIVADAERILSGMSDINERSSFVLHSDDWHIGVIGIAAAKIAERTGKPAIIISKDTKPPRGSARTVEGVNLIEALSHCDDLLLKYGGHKMAAGITIDPDMIDDFAKRFDEVCARLTPSDQSHRIKIDATIRPSEITSVLIEEILTCRPFGIGNPEPVLAMENVKVLNKRIVGDKHLKLQVGTNETKLDAIGFGMGEHFSNIEEYVSIAFVPQFNTWNGITSVQLKLKDLKTAP